MTAYKRMLQQSRDGATRRPGNTKTTKDLDMLRDTQHPDIVMACDMLQSLSEEDKAKNAQWAREKELHDIASLIADGREEGWEDGRKEGWEDGKKEGKKETAVNMLSFGMSIDVIEKITGLTAAEIKALSQEAD